MSNRLLSEILRKDLEERFPEKGKPPSSIDLQDITIDIIRKGVRAEIECAIGLQVTLLTALKIELDKIGSGEAPTNWAVPNQSYRLGIAELDQRRGRDVDTSLTWAFDVSTGKRIGGEKSLLNLTVQLYHELATAPNTPANEAFRNIRRAVIEKARGSSLVWQENCPESLKKTGKDFPCAQSEDAWLFEAGLQEVFRGAYGKVKAEVDAQVQALIARDAAETKVMFAQMVATLRAGKDSDRALSRRKFLKAVRALAIAATPAAILGIDAAIRKDASVTARLSDFLFKETKSPPKKTIPAEPEKPPTKPAKPVQPVQPTKPAKPEQREIPAAPTPFEQVLAKSEPIFLTETRTYRDNVLSPDAVTHYFLNDSLRYTGQEEVDYGGRRQRAHRFSQIGDKSGFLTKNPASKDAWRSTTLVKVINTLLAVETLSAAKIADWIAFEYQRSFGINFNAQKIKIKRDGETKAVTGVFYTDPAGADIEAEVRVAKVMEESSPTQPGGRLSARKETQKIIGGDGNLLLPSGLSPKHDVVVPVELLKQDAEFTLEVNNGAGITWKGIRASELAARIRRMKARARNSIIEQTSKYGRPINFKLLALLLERGDSRMKQLAEFLVKEIPADEHAGRIAALFRFVQSLPYVTEYDSDMDREGMLTLFNGGGDCNNVSDLFAELMLASGYDVAFMRVCYRNNKDEIHVMGGIPQKYFPLAAANWVLDEEPEERWVAIELTGRGMQPGVPKMSDDMDSTVFTIEVLRANP